MGADLTAADAADHRLDLGDLHHAPLGDQGQPFGLFQGDGRGHGQIDDQVALVEPRRELHAQQWEHAQTDRENADGQQYCQPTLADEEVQHRSVEIQQYTDDDRFAGQQTAFAARLLFTPSLAPAHEQVGEHRGGNHREQ